MILFPYIEHRYIGMALIVVDILWKRLGCSGHRTEINAGLTNSDKVRSKATYGVFANICYDMRRPCPKYVADYELRDC